MRKLLLLLLTLIATVTATAEDYPYLTIVETDGTKTSLTAVGLTIRFSGGSLVAVNAYTDEAKTISLERLSSLRFSSEDETSGIRSIEAESKFSLEEADAIYSLQGQRQNTASRLKAGIYIARKGRITQKVQVR